MDEAKKSEEEEVKEILKEVKELITSKFNFDQQNYFLREIRDMIVTERTCRVNDLTKEMEILNGALNTM